MGTELKNLFSLTPLRLRRLGIIAGVGAVLCCIYYFMDPALSPYAPKCIVRLLTGYDCPGCGSQRAIHALLHADLAGALRSNLLLVVTLPYLIFWVWVETDPACSPRLHRTLNSPVAIYIILTLIITWWVVRNIF